MAKPEQLVNVIAPQVPVPSLDLLQSFAAVTALPLLQFPQSGQEERELGDEGLELSLGLSLSGQFRVNPGSSKLARSASISDVKSSLGGDFNGDGCNGFGSGTARTCSLPVENKGVIGGDKKRKDAMARPRIETRRRKMEEKLRDADPCETSNNSGVGNRNGLVSLLSRRSGSLRIESLEIQVSGVTNPGISQERPGIATNPGELPTTSTSEKLCQDECKQTLKTMLENMPSVSTKGNGPNGKKVEGFLYRYRKCDEVRIVCVCHGSFFTPSEFVKHAGGGDVAHPLRHILVSSPPTL